MATVSYNRSKIMSDAWIIVRRFLGNGETLPALLSRALRSAWSTAKDNAAVARRSAANATKQAAQALRPSVDIWTEIQNLENRSFLGHDGVAKLSDLRTAYHASCKREATEKAASDMAEKRALIASANGRFASVVFTKKNGSRRVMRVQPAALKYHVVGDAASDAAKKAVETRAARHPNLLPVWDTDRAAVRSVNLATVSRIAVNGAVHEFATH